MPSERSQMGTLLNSNYTGIFRGSYIYPGININSVVNINNIYCNQIPKHNCPNDVTQLQ